MIFDIENSISKFFMKCSYYWLNFYLNGDCSKFSNYSNLVNFQFVC